MNEAETSDANIFADLVTLLSSSQMPGLLK